MSCEKVTLIGTSWEFHITNVCNLTCNNCNRFSNDPFKGFQKWDDYKEDYKKWSEKVDLPYLSILGGEPLLNPTFMDWFKGLRELWPDSTIQIVTNGTRLDKIPGLYEEVLKYKEKTHINLNIHSHFVKDRCNEAIRNFLKGNLTTRHENEQLREIYDQVKGEDWPETFEDVSDLPNWVIEEIKNNFNHNLPLEPTRYKDENGVRIRIQYSIQFADNPLKRNKQNRLTLRNSDPHKAHDACYGKRCHHFYKGRLHKCMLTALMPEYDNQFNLDLSNSDRDLLHSAKSLSSDSSIDNIKEFYDFIESDNPIPQCKFCPEYFKYAPTEAKFK